MVYKIDPLFSYWRLIIHVMLWWDSNSSMPPRGPFEKKTPNNDDFSDVGPFHHQGVYNLLTHK